ncbi:MAG TPA: Ig-like domain-containing protein, partial [Thermoanaerobaculia bacterium]|nr:Ig-like domain-containing protein [Thermoanaerobaculia bacterium]
MTRTALLSLSHLALLGLASSRGLLGQGCTTGLPNHNPQGELVTTPFFGNVEVVPGTPVTLYVDEGLRNSPIITESRVREGANAWNNACSKRNIPRFELNWTGSRPQLTPGDSTSVAYRTSIQLKLIDTFAPPVQGHLDTYEMAFHSPADNTISIYSKCPQFTTAGFPCAGGRPGGAILWSTPGMFEAVLAHEIGHSLWLDHDRTGGSCGGGVMAANWQQGVPSAIRPEHCDLADAMNNANRKCNYADAEPGEQHPCEHDDGTTLDGDPGGPEGAGHGLAGLFCEEYPWLCRSRPPWPGGGISCQWACVSTTIDFSDTITDCSWVCGATPTGPSEAPPSPESLATNQGFGPHLAVKLPDPGSVVSGVITVQGFAMDFGGLGSVSFGVDGTETVLSQYSVGFRDDDACRLPLGLPHPRCLPNSGYSGRLDTRSLSNGPHTLQVVATDRFGWTTSAEIPFVVDNPTCETEQPTISLTAPANGATVSGTVPLAATASDNVGVSVVKFYADGSLLGSDTTSPYTGSWNAAAAAAIAFWTFIVARP